METQTSQVAKGEYGWVAMCSYVLLYVAMCGKVWLSAGQGAPGVGTCVAMCSHV